MKIKFIFFICLVFLTACSQSDLNQINIIPEPQSVQLNSGEFLLDSNTGLIFPDSSADIKKAADYFQSFINNSSGYELAELTGESRAENVIVLNVNKEFAKSDEGYQLSVTDDMIEINASSGRGIFYGIQTLLQLMDPEIYSDEADTSFQWEIPAVKIIDEPRFPYRGMHLDVCRHFFPVEFVKKYIDLIAMHKMNKFHWHLTEDQGWRIEIKKYPKLTSVGAWRNETMGDGERYGGFYTQDEIREIVQYASDRFITIIPEIEMPGHSVAALAAYPELSCSGGPFEVESQWGVKKDIYCAGKEKTFHFLEDVLDEVCELFPGKYIHIGGDEAPKDRWKKCRDCQARIKHENLKDESELQSYFIKRIEQYLISKGKRLIGWDEILEGGLAPEATVMSWRGIAGGIAAAQQGHDVIMTPGTHCYFDHYQGKPENEPLAIGGFTPLTKVYSYEPVPDTLSESEGKFILGAQANVWTEYIAEPEQVEFMAVPRMAALAEVVWTNPENKNFDDFIYRLNDQFDRYDYMSINYSESYYSVYIMPEFNPADGKVYVRMTTESDTNNIRYTLNGIAPDENSNLYSNEFSIDKSAVISARIINERVAGAVSKKIFNAHIALGREVKYTNPFSEKYSAGGNFGLVDGLYGSDFFRDGKWQGIQKDDFDVLIDFGERIELHKISLRFLQRQLSWIFLPEYVEFFASEDGATFKQLGKVENDVSPKFGNTVIKDFSLEFADSARYIKIHAQNLGVCPDWHYASGSGAWLFVDEITIN